MTSPLLRAGLILALVLVGWYGFLEIMRWVRPETHDLISDRQKRLRAWGLLFLLASLGLWLNGTYLPDPRTRQQLLRYFFYWAGTVLCVVPLVPLALLDSRENLRRLQTERRRLMQETLSASQTPAEPAPPTKPGD